MYAHTYTLRQLDQLGGALKALLDSGALDGRDLKMADTIKERLDGVAFRMRRDKREGQVIVHMSEEEEVFIDGVHEALWG